MKIKWETILNVIRAIVNFLKKKDGASSTSKEEKTVESTKSESSPVRDVGLANLIIEKPNYNVQYLIVHHSQTFDSENEDTVGIRRYHMEENGWMDIGYHWLIERIESKYKIIKGRTMTKQGAHARDGGMNNKSLGICVVGNFDDYEPNKFQLFILKSLLREFQRMFNVPSQNVLGHREAQRMFKKVKIKTCPGKLFDMDKLRRDLL